MKDLSLEVLRMADFLAHACVCSDEAASPIQEPEDEQLEQDDSIPAKTQRHLASFLAEHSNGQLTSDQLLPKLMNSPYINQKRKILNRTILDPTPSRGLHSVFAAWMSSHFERRLQELPAEVLCMIESYLDPSDLVCLGRSCRALFQAVDYQMVDLRNLSFAEDLWPVLRENALDFALAKERYGVVRRLHRDRLEQLEYKTRNTDWKACGSCVKPHPRRYFSPTERTKSVYERRCLASTAPIRICSHWTEDIHSLRQRREDADCEPRPLDFFRTDECAHVDHEFQGFSAPRMRDLGSAFSVERTITLLQTNDRDSIDEDVVEDVLTSEVLQDIQVCRHLRLGDRAILSSFKRRPPPEVGDLADLIMAAVGYMPEFEPASCEECGRTWQFSILDNLGYRQSPRYSLRLVVDEQIKAVRDPWTEEYLRKVEGGREFTELM
ncbi:hypothetical protein PRZ48_014984 [Zasmidium cellare]|uniref:F-box domain-containing protein n=1 Tax=Zasmidium cellare TaxID=395010 RepID=A0ABR0DXH9_ZASCE|nr:hypothetical protein PRZ48_014984 [Zasmidium cellare]